MNKEDSDRKILEEIASETKKLNEFLDSYSVEEVKKNVILQKAICLRLLHLFRAYKKLGGRYAERFGEYHEKLKGYAQKIESGVSSFDASSLIEGARKELPLLLSRVNKIKESL